MTWGFLLVFIAEIALLMYIAPRLAAAIKTLQDELRK